MIAFDFALLIVAILATLPALLLLLQVVLVFLPSPTRSADGKKHPSVAILIPAHNEASGIAATLQSVTPQLLEGDRILVVADNCTDATAATAAAAGAEVIVRNNRELLGKGYALDFGIRHFAADPREVVIVVDADCQVEEQAIERLAQACGSSQRPVQALYLMHSPNRNLKQRLAEFAWVVRNHVRPLGLYRAGLPCQLMGTGMAFPWRLISTAVLAHGHLVEDLKLGIDFARSGAAPLFCPEARVSSEFATSSEGLASQRTRWEHGHLGMIVDEGPRLFLESLVRRNPDLLVMALDLCIPPLALLVLILLGLWGITALLYAATGSWWAFGVSSFGVATVCLAVIMAWGIYGRTTLTIKELGGASLYALGKIPLYLQFLLKRQVEWVRSKRD